MKMRTRVLCALTVALAAVSGMAQEEGCAVDREFLMMAMTDATHYASSGIPVAIIGSMGGNAPFALGTGPVWALGALGTDPVFWNRG